MATAPLPSWAAQPDRIRDALLGFGGTVNLWNTSNLTYAFPTDASGIANPEREAFTAIGGGEQAVFTLALELWDDVIAASIEPLGSAVTSPTSASFEFGYYSRSHLGGYAVRGAYNVDTGSVWISGDTYKGKISVVAGYGFLVLLHEIGHALGLDHPGPYSETAANAVANAQFFEDSSVYTVMSYLGPANFVGSGLVEWADWTGSDSVPRGPQTPMIWDLRAVQAVFGADRDTRSGDTVYGFGSNVGGLQAGVFDFRLNPNPILTIYDTGGTDTLDLSGYNSASQVDLRPGASSSVSWMTRNIWIADGTEIENVRGGSGPDWLSGNALSNRLEGGAGNDVLDGREGEDTAVFSGRFSDYRLTYDRVSPAVLTLRHAQDGTDTVTGIEWLQFADRRVASGDALAAATRLPVLTATMPAHEAARVPTTAVLVLQFSEDVRPGSGDIAVGLAGTLGQSIPITDAEQVRFDGSRIIIDLKQDFFANRVYRVLVGEGVVLAAASDGAWSGIGAQMYRFTTSNTGQPPAVADGSARGTEDRVLEGRLPSAADPDGDALIYLLASPPAHGRASIAGDGSFRYQPGPDFSGSDAFLFDVVDAFGARTSRTFRIDVTDVRDPFAGTAGPDDMVPHPGGDDYLAGAGNDRIRPGAGDDSIDGGAGVDTVVFTGRRAEFAVARDGAGWTVAGTAQGLDRLAGVERLAFDDLALALDIEGGRAGTAALLVNALFGKRLLGEPAVVGTVLELLDGGATTPALVASAIGHPLFVELAGSSSHVDFVRWVYRNVVGQPPPAADLAELVSLLDAGVFTPVSLALLAIEHPANAVQADLVGLAGTGLATITGA